ncbi:unnamed protein product [Paramecium pentaurelia]|uniref:Uncharacterized protein n=1 Tax=Paramecium pentaurelia TaxID=43138 RepID=A0A8S1XX39_9CILI|nr:unnamed protein product [Paramecium pentaurelia]
MAHVISFLKILFLKSIIYENCITDNMADCRYTDFSIVGINSATLERCGSQPQNLFMGPFGFQTSVTKAFTNIPPNKELEFSVNIWKFDSWDSEGFEIYANNVLIKNLILGNEAGTQICRNNIFSDFLYTFSQKMILTGTDLTIKLKDNLNSASYYEDLLDESWGFRDFILRLSVPCVNFYDECNYTGTLFQICQGEQSKLQNYIPFEIKSILMGPGIIVKLKDKNYFAGVLQEFTTSQSCLNGYKFPKVLYSE